MMHMHLTKRKGKILHLSQTGGSRAYLNVVSVTRYGLTQSDSDPTRPDACLTLPSGLVVTIRQILTDFRKSFTGTQQ